MCNEKRVVKQTHYEFDLTFNPVAQKVNVQGQMIIPLDNDTANQIDFYLHRQLNVSNLELNGKKHFELCKDTSDIRYMPDAIKYTLKSPESFNKKARISFKYSGKITQWHKWSASVIGKEWTEMACYFPWYPYHMQFRPFTYQVDITPIKDYNIFLMGQKNRVDDGIRFKTPYPTNDIVVCASKNLKTIKHELGNFTFKLAYTTLSDTLINTLSADVKKILTTYNQWFIASDTSICLIESMREKGGAYARKGGMYLTDLNKTAYFDRRKRYMRYLSHEISHLWWYRANTNSWEDWLNEGFAEYSALMIIRDQYGQDYFQSWIDHKKKQMKATEPIWHCDRNSKNAYTILYSKAPVLIYQLEQKIGKKAFNKLIQTMQKKEVATTRQFLILLEDQEGSKIKEWFKNQLMNA